MTWEAKSQARHQLESGPSEPRDSEDSEARPASRRHRVAISTAGDFCILSDAVYSSCCVECIVVLCGVEYILTQGVRQMMKCCDNRDERASAGARRWTQTHQVLVLVCPRQLDADLHSAKKTYPDTTTCSGDYERENDCRLEA